MAMVVKNNIPAQLVLGEAKKNDTSLTKSLKKVSSGMRINGAGDDASGYSISERMRVMVRGLDQDVRNTQNGQSVLKTAEGAVASTVEILKTFKEKALDAANDTNTDVDRATIQKQLDQMISQLDDNAHVSYNGKLLLTGELASRPTGPAQEVIASFVSSLDYTTKQGKDALSEAIKYASAELFEDETDLLNHFLGDLKGSVSGDAFLKKYCDIDLDNKDTGSITGLDAGGETEKTAESVVPEKGSPYIGPVPGGGSVINGLTVNWPATYGNAGAQAAEEAIAKALNGQWLENCLNLVEDSYEINFMERGTTVNTIDVVFDNNNVLSSSTLAAVGFSYNSATGKANSLTLYVNMAYYNNVNLSNPNGATSTPGATYLDRTIAHEMTHALMAANIDFFDLLPKYIIEGSAELVHGIDDDRKSTIQSLVNNPSYLESILNDQSSSPSVTRNNGDEDYAAGYMVLRYLAKQSRYQDPKPKMALQTGTKANQAVKVGFYDMRAQALGLQSRDGTNISVLTRQKAVSTLKKIDSAIDKALRQQTTLGAYQSRLEFTAENLTTASENVQSSESTIRDADMAREMTEYTKNNVLLQASQAMLAQANQNAGAALGLLG